MAPSLISKISAKSSLCFFIMLLMAVHAGVTRADSTDGSTPLALQPGTPAGSYALSDLDNVNPYNGSLNFRLPLLSIGGRGKKYSPPPVAAARRWATAVATASASNSPKRKGTSRRG